MPRPKSSALVNACRILAASLKADMGKANSDPTLLGREKDLWAADLIRLSNNLLTTISSLGLGGDPNGERVHATGAYRQAKEKWQLLTDRVWHE